ncbi:hypothetical protein [Nonomuraea polychroma]|uniref:hypothetical protein n=1 Tax=Nonomuraea polychroma TaxID=46176 RepID=UPI000FDE13F3|nr:hypothetical protein [Nonomuraea polychroma]
MDAEDRFWDMVEEAWAPLGEEVGRARQALTDRSPIDRAAVTGGSDDGFLYARRFIVAMGRDFCSGMLRNPDVRSLSGVWRPPRMRHGTWWYARRR